MSEENSTDEGATDQSVAPDVDYSAMSDDEISNINELPPIVPQGVEEEFSEPDAEEQQEDPNDDAFDDDQDPTEDDDSEVPEGDGETPEEEQDETPDGDTNSEDENQSEDDEDPETDTEAQQKVKDLERIFAPFKANGRDMQVDNVEDVISLMQMGANYNKKMAGLKEPLKFVKMLKNNDLMDESKLGLVIDATKGKPEAIAKLLKDSGIDPMDLDTDKTEDYKSDTYTVSDEEVAMDNVLDDIRGTDSFATTIETVRNKLDEQSRKVLLANPDSIKIINDHIASGLYDQVMGVVEKERALGRLQNVSDLEAYQAVGKQLQEAGVFNTPEQNASNSNENNNSTESPNAAKKSEQEAKRRSRKKAAAGPTGNPKGKPNETEYDIMNMSDEDFEKFGDKQGLSHI